MYATAKKRDEIYICQGCFDARDAAFKGVPDGVVVCPACGGNGRRRQWYLEGTMAGPCEMCAVTGFVYADTARPVSVSVLNQIAVASGFSFDRFEAEGIRWRKGRSS